MNEQIHELYTQVVGDDKLNFDSYLAEKFAELIVKKCGQIAIHCDAGCGDLREGISQQIKQHFGVEP